jgi:hypothetical protein
MPLFIPPLIGWTLGALGAAAVAKVLIKEWHRVNDELHRRERMAEAPARDGFPTLRRDPSSGVYRPE